jgi:hypothetical protein
MYIGKNLVLYLILPFGSLDNWQMKQTNKDTLSLNSRLLNGNSLFRAIASLRGVDHYLITISSS